MFPPLANNENFKILQKLKEQEEKAARLKIDRSRFVFSNQTKNEFNLKESDIPVFMREKINMNDYKNHVEKNVQTMESSNDRNKINYLSKLKLNTQTQLTTQKRNQQQMEQKREKHQIKFQKWDDFRIRK